MNYVFCFVFVPNVFFVCFDQHVDDTRQHYHPPTVVSHQRNSLTGPEKTVGGPISYMGYQSHTHVSYHTFRDTSVVGHSVTDW